jgi:hypothetical protein
MRPLLCGVTRAYQSDSSSKPPHRRAAPVSQDPLDAGARPPSALRYTFGRAARRGGLQDVARRKRPER